MSWIIEDQVAAHHAGADLKQDQPIFAVSPNILKKQVNQLLNDQHRNAETTLDNQLDYWTALTPREQKKCLKAVENLSKKFDHQLQQTISETLRSNRVIP